MIKKYLERMFKQKRLYNSWLINAGNTVKALENLLVFIKNHLLTDKIQLHNHPDYRLVTKDNSGSNIKGISVDQIRDLQQFFYRTSSISKYRVAIIYQADLMNISAANSCLKLLEDTPTNSFIFLITSRAAGIISTIRSRCAKISINSQNYLVKSDIYVKFITHIANCLNPKVRLDIIEEFSNKNKGLWEDFAYSMLHLINRMTKKSLNINIEFHESENRIFKQLVANSPGYLLIKFTNIKRILNNTVDYDLDLRTSTIALIEELIQ